MLFKIIFILAVQTWANPVARDLPYQRVPKSQTLDIYIPKNSIKPYKTVVHLHGGCFQWGDKADEDSMEQISRLTQAGYAVVSVNYRLSSPDPSDPTKSLNPYPAALNDVQDAWCWIQNEGARYDLNTDKIAALGLSAGATLATYLGTGHTAGSQHVLNCKPKVAAVIDLFGRTNFLRATEPHADPSQLDCGESFVGQHRNERNPQQGFHDADVLTHLDVQTAAPMFITHGDADQAVNFQNSRDLCDKLGVKCELKPIHNAGHMFTGPGEMDEAYLGIYHYLANGIFRDLAKNSVSF